MKHFESKQAPMLCSKLDCSCLPGIAAGVALSHTQRSRNGGKNNFPTKSSMCRSPDRISSAVFSTETLAATADHTGTAMLTY